MTINFIACSCSNRFIRYENMETGDRITFDCPPTPDWFLPEGWKRPDGTVAKGGFLTHVICVFMADVYDTEDQLAEDFKQCKIEAYARLRKMNDQT